MSALKNEIYSIIDNIIKQEDELNKFLYNKDNQSILSNISKNKQRIESLSSFISKESQLSESKIKILNDEIFSLQNEISNLNNPNTKYDQKDMDQNLIKEKFINKTIKLHENELIQIEENLKLLKEEKLSSSNELLNFMSLRENYEELIRVRAKYIFNSSKIKKTISDSENNNITEINLNLNQISENKINIEYHDIMNIQSISKLCNFIYKIISSNIVANFSSLLIELNLKNVIMSSINAAFNKFIKNNSHYNKSGNFIRDISVNIVNSDIKISNLFIQPQFEILLKYIFKLFSIEKTINDELKFVNNDYAYNKNILKNKKENILNKIKDCNKQKITIDNEKQKIKTDCKTIKNYLDKVQEYKNLIKIKESEISKINNELVETKKMYQNQINNLENTNKNLENKVNNNDFKYQIENINQQINYLFTGIKNKIKNINDIDQKNQLINEMIQDINKCLENDGNINYNTTLNNNIKDYTSIHIKTNNNNNTEINEELNKILNENKANNNEEEEISDELLSSYNSTDDIKNNENNNYQNIRNNIIDNKINKTEVRIKNPKNLSLQTGKNLIFEPNKNRKFSQSNKSLNLKNHKNYLKLSECFKLNN